MLFNQPTLDGIRDGKITRAFRRWTRPMVRVGTRLRTAVGELEILAVDKIADGKVTAAEAKRAGFSSVDELLADMRAGAGRQLYRVKLKYAGRDQRETLRERATLSGNERTEIAAQLARYDAASRVGSWTDRMLQLIAKYPELSAGELAKLGGYEKEWLKVSVRKLKELGLTESLQPGYRLSPRGKAYLKARRGK
jgi:hypothetical protein